ncbi:MAG: response regulator [Actinomycetota bacterium]
MEAHILVVDDDPVIRHVLSAVLGSDGYRVTLASGGEEALRAANASPPDLVVVDAMMDGMDGYEVCRRVRAGTSAGSPPYVLLLTASASTVDGARAAAAGIDAVVAKPVDAPGLLARVRQALSGRQGGP